MCVYVCLEGIKVFPSVAFSCIEMVSGVYLTVYFFSPRQHDCFSDKAK